MSLHDYVQVLRRRWITLVLTTLFAVLSALAYTLTATPQYQASTRLYVSAESGSTVTDLYQGNRLSQERVLSYTQLIMGETLAQRTINRLKLDMNAASLKANVTAAAKPNTVLISVAVRDTSPVRARDIANGLSDEFVQMVRELETPPAMGAAPNARVVVEQRASMPAKPVTPKMARNLLAGLLAGFGLGVVFALLRDRLDNTVKDRDTLEAITGVGLVGSIPTDKEIHKKPAIVFEGNSSPVAESFRKIRTNLQFLAVDNPPRAIVVTSASPGEGKSTTALNIALALAEAEHTVVLVDGDMRRPSVDKYLDLVGAVGFSTVLSGGASLAEVLQKTKFTNLTALTCGSTPPNPSELLGSQTAKNVLNELREQFDYVIIDSSPLLAVTDGALLAASSDGTLIMSRYGETKRQELVHALGNLRDVGAPVLGAVFTMISRRRGGYDYSYGYGYYGNDPQKAAAEEPVGTPLSRVESPNGHRWHHKADPSNADAGDSVTFPDRADKPQC